MFKKVLIANRGEIALRILRACRELNIKTVAIHSEADESAMHVRMADESVCVGPASAQSSYLNIPAIITAATITNVDAIHPGYGFLSENQRFAEIIEEHNVKFIGPNSQHIKMMGNKISARKIMKDNNVPIVPGLNDISDKNKIKQFIDRTELPIIIKAASGGGGKGMRIIKDYSELDKSINAAKLEAKKSVHPQITGKQRVGPLYGHPIKTHGFILLHPSARIFPVESSISCQEISPGYGLRVTLIL